MLNLNNKPEYDSDDTDTDDYNPDRITGRTYINDYNLALEAISKNGKEMRFISDELKSDYNFAMDALAANPKDKNRAYRFKYLAKELKDNEEIMKIAINMQGRTLEYMRMEARNNKDIITTAILNDPLAFWYADTKYKYDEEYILYLIKICPNVMVWVDYSIRYDRPFILRAMSVNGLAYCAISSIFKRDKEIYLTALNNCGNSENLIKKWSIRHYGPLIESNFTLEQFDIRLCYS